MGEGLSGKRSFKRDGKVYETTKEPCRRYLHQKTLKALKKDNAKMESFFRTLKVEEVYTGEDSTYESVLLSLPNFIAEVYNKKRLHSFLRHMPMERT